MILDSAASPATDSTSGPTRRSFLSTSATAAGVALGATVLAPQVYAGGNDVLRIGLIGCGGRGTGAASQALHADPNVKLVALGDAFMDRCVDSLRRLREEEDIARKIDVPKENLFDGFDAYKKVIDCGVDVVLLCSPPHFRAQHIEAAVAAGKHIFAEKPVAVDAPGVRRVLEASKLAKQKKLSIVSGLCYRYQFAKRETMARVHEGQIGDIVAMHTNYNVGGLWHKKKEPNWSDMEWQVRNWLYFAWLSGDHIVEQHIHSLDKMAWAMKNEYPIRATGLGGRQVRTGPEFGHIFDHHAVVYEYKSGVKLFSYTRQQNGCAPDVSDYVMGTEGTCAVQSHMITGKKPWKHAKARDNKDDMYQNEHDELFASIRTGAPINNGEYMSYSTLMAIMGRMATYTGQTITWEKALESPEDLSPAKYEWGPLPVPPVAMPGVTKFS